MKEGRNSIVISTDNESERDSLFNVQTTGGSLPRTPDRLCDFRSKVHDGLELLRS